MSDYIFKVRTDGDIIDLEDRIIGHINLEYIKSIAENPQGKWVISEIQCPNCFEYFETDCYSAEELKKCPNCGADMRNGQ